MGSLIPPSDFVEVSGRQQAASWARGSVRTKFIVI
jgi:hypothetical protein